jgi:hypothetical protein
MCRGATFRVSIAVDSFSKASPAVRSVIYSIQSGKGPILPFFAELDSFPIVLLWVVVTCACVVGMQARGILVARMAMGRVEKYHTHIVS